jgi:hypothetical protein
MVRRHERRLDERASAQIRILERRYGITGGFWVDPDNENHCAFMDDYERGQRRRWVDLLRGLIAMLASWTRPVLQPVATSDPAPLPLVDSQLVKSLVSAPAAPPRPRWC